MRPAALLGMVRNGAAHAERHGHLCAFLTLLPPSRFYSTGRDYDGSTPADAHRWLQAHWAKARAEIQRRGASVYGVRLAVPSRDGTPCWAVVLWSEGVAQEWMALKVLQRYWVCGVPSDYVDTAGLGRARIEHMGRVAPGLPVREWMRRAEGWSARSAAWAAVWRVRTVTAFGVLRTREAAACA